MDTKGLANRPWVLLPGTLCTGAVFDGVLDEIGVPHSNRQVMPLTLGAVKDYAPLLEDLPDGAIVCGFSLGALVAAHHADRMQAHRLVLFGLNPFADDPAKATGRHELAKDVKSLGGGAALRARKPAVFGAVPDETRGVIYDMADRTADLIDAHTRLALTRPGAVPALAHAQLPVLTLTGEHDTSAPPNGGIAGAQAAPNGQFIMLGGLGHYALLEDPRACAAAIIDAA